MLELFTLPFVQRGLLEVVALALAAGLLGTWIVLRGLAFYAHAVGTAAFPGLVLADGLGFPALLGAFGTAIAVAAIARRERGADDTASALVLVAALALGVILASDVFTSTGGVDQLLFGSLLLTGPGDLALAVAASAAALLATALSVVPAATTRLVCDRRGPWQLATVALVMAEGVAGLWASVQLNA